MLKVGILKPFKLKTTNGNILAYYGNCNINLTTVPFRDMKTANQSDRPFITEQKDFLYKHNNTKRIKTTTHILAVDPRPIFQDDNNYIIINSESADYNANKFNSLENMTISVIPNLVETETNEKLQSFIESIQNKTLKKSLKIIFYNLTHGEAPYSNPEYQENNYVNTFAFYSDENTYPFSRENLNSATGANGYPQNSIIFIPQDWSNPLEHPYFYYNTDTITRNINTNDTFYTLPYHGICGMEYNILYFYWTTYKGV